MGRENPRTFCVMFESTETQKHASRIDEDSVIEHFLEENQILLLVVSFGFVG